MGSSAAMPVSGAVCNLACRDAMQEEMGGHLEEFHVHEMHDDIDGFHDFVWYNSH